MPQKGLPVNFIEGIGTCGKSECDKVDKQEEGSFVKLKEDLKDQEKLREKVKLLIDEMDEKQLSKINTTDKDCINFKSRQGSHAGYNAQVVTDEKHGLIVSTDVVSKAEDSNQFSQQIQQANDNLDKQCEIGCGDAGYSNTINVKDSVEKGIDVIVPSQKQALHNKIKDDPYKVRLQK